MLGAASLEIKPSSRWVVLYMWKARDQVAVVDLVVAVGVVVVAAAVLPVAVVVFVVVVDVAS